MTDLLPAAAPYILKRSRSRLLAVQALFQVAQSKQPTTQVLAEFEQYRVGKEIEGLSFKSIDKRFFRDLLLGASTNQAELDPLIDSCIVEGWNLEKIDPVLLAIFRCASFELKYKQEVPHRVIFSEYLSMTEAFFGNHEEIKFANGVLNEISCRLKTANLPESGPIFDHQSGDKQPM